MVSRVAFAGMTHLGQTLSRAAAVKGFEIAPIDDAEIVFVTQDVAAPDDLGKVNGWLVRVSNEAPADVPVVLMSQVPPGFTRRWGGNIFGENLFYQADTLIMNCAFERALKPERHIVGCAQSAAPLPATYAEYLAAFPAPVFKMSFEAAELAKMAVNVILAAQVSAANALAAVAIKVGAYWDDIIPALQTDARIGKAYLDPGVIGGHLPRDVIRLREILGEQHAFASAIGPLVESSA